MAKTNSISSTFKISELPEIKNLDGKDVFLISDEENGKLYTRKLSFNKLLTVLAENPDFVEKLIADDKLSSNIANTVNNYMESADFDVTEINGGNAFGEN